MNAALTLGLSSALSSKSMQATGDEVTRVTGAVPTCGVVATLNDETQSASTAKMIAAIERMFSSIEALGAVQCAISGRRRLTRSRSPHPRGEKDETKV